MKQVSPTMQKNPSTFEKLAAKARMPVKKFAEANIHTDSEVGRMARLWYTAQGVHGSGKAQMNVGGDPNPASRKLYQVG